MTKMKISFFVGITLMLALAVPLHAQSGCVNSPEDPTIVLALVAGGGALAMHLRAARARKR